MKIQSLVNKPTLNDLFDVQGELNWSKLDLFEILNTEIPISWNHKGRNLLGSFLVDESSYTIVLEPASFEKYSFINIAFYKDDKDYELSLNTKSPTKVLGAILNGIHSKLDEFHYDAIVFSAANNVEKRMAFYNRLADRFKKFFSKIIEDVKTKHGKCTILIANTVKKDEIDKFIAYITDAAKS
jgi:hypothetical protein